VSKRYQTIDAGLSEGLLALAVGAGLQTMQTMQTMFSQDVSVLCGPKGRHDPTGRAIGTVPRPGR